MDIKKDFQPVYKRLEELAASGKKLTKKDLAEFAEMVQQSRRGKAEAVTLWSAKGNKPVAIQCWIYQRWMPLVGPKAVEFGPKASSNTGLDRMCKEASQLWYRTYTSQKRNISALAQAALTGEVTKEEAQKGIAEQKARLDAVMASTNEELGFATKEEVLAYLAEHKIEVKKEI